MEVLIEIVVQLFLELFGGLIMEGIAELISRLFRVTFQPRAETQSLHVPRAIACQLAGVAAGLVSLLFAGQHIIKSPPIRFINLAVTPVLMALALVAWGRFMQKRDREKTPLNRFVCAYGLRCATCWCGLRLLNEAAILN